VHTARARFFPQGSGRDFAGAPMPRLQPDLSNRKIDRCTFALPLLHRSGRKCKPTLLMVTASLAVCQLLFRFEKFRAGWSDLAPMKSGRGIRRLADTFALPASLDPRTPLSPPEIAQQAGVASGASGYLAMLGHLIGPRLASDTSPGPRPACAGSRPTLSPWEHRR
jgi:hypothetical protein